MDPMSLYPQFLHLQPALRGGPQIEEQVEAICSMHPLTSKTPKPRPAPFWVTEEVALFLHPEVNPGPQPAGGSSSGL